jgi:hypothetical protein
MMMLSELPFELLAIIMFVIVLFFVCATSFAMPPSFYKKQIEKDKHIKQLLSKQKQESVQ